MEIGVHILFTPAAKAVQRGPTFQASPQHRQLLWNVQVGDTVRTPPCSEAFLVIARQWTMEPEVMRLDVILDLLEDPKPSLVMQE